MTTQDATTVPDTGRQMLIGLASATVTVLIWALWIVATRQAATVRLPAAWLGIFRFAVPAVVLMPFWWRDGLLPRGLDWRLLAVMVAGAGAPFFLVVAMGAAYAMAAEGAVLLGGTMPLFVAILSAVIYRERFSASRVAGFVLVLLAMAAIGGEALLGGHGVGRFLLTVGAVLWAGYTVAFRRSGLDAVKAAGITAAWSTILLLPLALYAGVAPLAAVGPSVIIGQLIAQGVLTGIVAIVCYGVAVNALGPSRAALMAALPPALAALIAVPVLGEIPSPLAMVGIVLVVVGVALGSGAVALGRR